MNLSRLTANNWTIDNKDIFNELNELLYLGYIPTFCDCTGPYCNFDFHAINYAALDIILKHTEKHVGTWLLSDLTSKEDFTLS